VPDVQDLYFATANPVEHAVWKRPQ